MVILGSGGARIVVAKQLRASGGIWFSLAGTRFLVDPGPGALVRMTGLRHRLDPTKLAGILLSHRHLDHSGDVNNMIEAMTMGGTEPRGALFAPSDTLGGDDPVVLKYVRPFLERIVMLAEGGSYELGNVRFTCPVRHQHRGEVYGFRFQTGRSSADYADSADDAGRSLRADVQTVSSTDYTDYADDTECRPDAEEGSRPVDRRQESEGRMQNAEVRAGEGLSADYADSADDTECRPERSEAESKGLLEATAEYVGRFWGQSPCGDSPPSGRAAGLTLSYIADTRYFPELAEHYRADVVVMNVVRPKPSQLDHLSAPDAEELVKAMRPKLAVLGHFGMRMLAAKPWVIAQEMSERTGCKVVAASDGMLIDLEEYKAASRKPQATSSAGENRLWGQSPSENLGDSSRGGAE